MAYITVDFLEPVFSQRRTWVNCPNLSQHIRGIFGITGKVEYIETETVGIEYPRYYSTRVTRTCDDCGGSKRVPGPDERFISSYIGIEYTFDTDERCDKCGGHGKNCTKCMGTGGVYVSKRNISRAAKNNA